MLYLKSKFPYSIICVSAFILVLLISCHSGVAQERKSVESNAEFNSYWYQGKAEITSYKLSQARYGEIHPGQAVMIFVTEDFSNKKHVKLDNPSQSKPDAVSVLKLNLTRKFNTGIYPYSMMTSVFTPIQKDLHALKVTTSSQEWCGHTFMQFDQTADGYKIKGHSYFESEGELDKKIEHAALEDEIWAQIRINSKKLPLGNIKMIPSQIFLRLRHVSAKPIPANARLETNPDNDSEWLYTITYEGIQRELSIAFEKEFPYEINGWSERNKSGFGSYAEIKETRAVKIKRIRTAYWRQNNLSDSSKYTSLFEVSNE